MEVWMPMLRSGTRVRRAPYPMLVPVWSARGCPTRWHCIAERHITLALTVVLTSVVASPPRQCVLIVVERLGWLWFSVHLIKHTERSHHYALVRVGQYLKLGAFRAKFPQLFLIRDYDWVVLTSSSTTSSPVSLLPSFKWNLRYFAMSTAFDTIDPDPPNRPQCLKRHL